MNWDAIKKRIHPAGGGMAHFAMPTVVFETEPGFVLGARLEGSSRQGRRVHRIGARSLEPGSLEPHPGRANVANGEQLRQAINEVVAIIGIGSGRLGLVVPDGAVRVSILTFETLPDESAEAEALVRWKMRDRLPFAPEEARVSIQVLSRDPGHVEVLAVAARISVLAEYEAALEATNGGPALILPATVALLPLLPEGDAKGQLLFHVCSRWVTSVALAGSRPCYWRTRELDAAAAENPAKEVAAEAVRILASTRDRDHAEFARAWICARPSASPELVDAVAGAVSHAVEVLTPRADLGSTLSIEQRKVFEQFGAPVAGIISNSG